MKKNNLANLFRKQIVSTIVSIILGFIVAGAILASIGFNPIKTYSTMFSGIFGKPRYIANTVISATPLILTGASVAFAFKTGLFNIGAEGQYMFGFIVAGILGIVLNLPPIIQVPVILIGGMLAGMIYGGFTGLLKAKFGVHEVITGIMLNWIAFYLNNFVAKASSLHMVNSEGTYPINPSGYIKFFPQMKSTDEGIQELLKNPILGDIFVKSDVNIGIFIAIAVVIILNIIIKKSTLGYQLRAVGFNKDAAEFAGINVKKNIIKSMAIAGAVAGLAGAVNITALNPHQILSLGVFTNYGFNGLAVALIAGNSIIGTVFAGLLFGGFLEGGKTIQSRLGAPSETISILIGIIIFFIAISKILPVIIEKIQEKKKSKEEK
ncbi:MAG: ABC transporter permease [Tissierellia bacterium]|nr:ABC transporter permease [Tissierellia bacterium]